MRADVHTGRAEPGFEPSAPGDATAPQSETIDDVLARTRHGVVRPSPAELAAELAGGALIVDIRPIEQRRRHGRLPGAVVIDRNVLEWRLDPMSPHRIAETGFDRRIIVVCNEGYASTLAAASLRALGLHLATDLIDGFQGWLAHSGTPR